MPPQTSHKLLRRSSIRSPCGGYCFSLSEESDGNRHKMSQNLGVSQRPLTLILLRKYRDTNGRHIVIQIGGVYSTFCQEEGIHWPKYRDRNGRCIAILFKSIGIRCCTVSQHVIRCLGCRFASQMSERSSRQLARRAVTHSLFPGESSKLGGVSARSVWPIFSVHSAWACQAARNSVQEIGPHSSDAVKCRKSSEIVIIRKVSCPQLC